MEVLKRPWSTKVANLAWALAKLEDFDREVGTNVGWKELLLDPFQMEGFGAFDFQSFVHVFF